MMSIKKKSRLWPICGCLRSIAWATCSRIIRLSLKISSGFFQVVSLASLLIRESLFLGFRSICEGWEFPCGRKVESPVVAAVEDSGWDRRVGRRLHEDVSHGVCWVERANPASAESSHSLAAPASSRLAPRPGAVEQEETREMQQLPVTKITPFYRRFSCLPSSAFKSRFGMFSAVAWQEPVPLHRQLSFRAFFSHFCESPGESAPV